LATIEAARDWGLSHSLSWQMLSLKGLSYNVGSSKEPLIIMLKGGGHSKKHIFFVNASNNLTLSLATH